MMNYLLLIGFTVLITLEIFNRVSVRPLVKIIEDLRDFDNDLPKLKAEREQLQSELLEQLEKRTEEGE